MVKVLIPLHSQLRYSRTGPMLIQISVLQENMEAI